MKNLPDTIIIRYDDKHCSEVKYKKATYCGYFNRTKQKYLIYSHSNSGQEIWAAIKRLCELWLEKDKIFFEYKGKKKIKYQYDAKSMLKFINN